MTENGMKVKAHEDMCSVLKEYFLNIFTGISSKEDIQAVEGDNCVTPEQNRGLVAEVTFEEFSLAVKQMHPDKASGPDGLNPAFF